MNEKQPLSDQGLTGSEVETWTQKTHSGTFVCFRNKRGELFHFKQNTLMRGIPRVPFNTIEEFCRPAGLLTLENAAQISGCSKAALQKAIERGKLRAIKKVWRYGRHKRTGILVDISDLESFMARRAIEKYKGKMIEWDVDPMKIVRASVA